MQRLLSPSISLSLSTSRSPPTSKAQDGKTEFQKNVDGVTGVLAQVPAGSHVTIIGITNRSFAQPYILLSASVPEDAGYFGERLTGRTLAAGWRLEAAKPHIGAYFQRN